MLIIFSHFQPSLIILIVIVFAYLLMYLCNPFSNITRNIYLCLCCLRWGYYFSDCKLRTASIYAFSLSQHSNTQIIFNYLCIHTSIYIYVIILELYIMFSMKRHLSTWLNYYDLDKDRLTRINTTNHWHESLGSNRCERAIIDPIKILIYLHWTLIFSSSIRFLRLSSSWSCAWRRSAAFLKATS